MKMIIASLMLTLCSLASAFENSDYYCQRESGSQARHGVEWFHLTFGEGIYKGRVLFSVVVSKAQQPLQFSAPGVYAHSANVHKGRYDGFMKYTPSTKFESPQALSQKFPSFVLKRSVNSDSLVVAFPESKNAIYSCRVSR